MRVLSDAKLATSSSPGPKAFEVVLGWVDARILEGELHVGDQLPAERELARELNVSRSAVREAMRTLQAQGVVRSSVGAGVAGGTIVTSVSAGALGRMLRLHVALARFRLPDVVEVRVALERLSARLAAASATSNELAQMRGLLELMAAPDIDRARFNDYDTAFHVAVAAAAGNSLVMDLTTAIRESMRLPILNRFHQIEAWESIVDGLRCDHEAIYEAVALGDGDRASELMEDHIRAAWNVLDSQARSQVTI